MSNSNRASKVIVDPQELTEFLRYSCDLSELDFEPENDGKGFEAEPATKAVGQPRPVTVVGVGTGSKEKTGWKRFAGILLSLSAGLFFTVSYLIIKILKNHHPLNLAFWRYFGFLAPVLPYLVYIRFGRGVNAFKSLELGDGSSGSRTLKNSIILVFATICGVTIFVLRFYSLVYLTIADSCVIIYSGPLFTIVFGHFYLKEKCGIVTIVLACFTLLGVIVISRPPFLTGKSELDTDILIGTGLAFGSTLLAAVYYTAMRGLRLIHFSVVSLISALIGLLETGILAWAMGVLQVPEGAREILLVAALGVLSLLGTGSIVLALKFEEAGTVSVLRMADVLYSFLFQYIFLSVLPDTYSIIGASIVITGVLLITFRKVLSTLPKEHGLRRTFRFLLL